MSGRYLKQTGITSEGVPVFSGVFNFVGTLGAPLEVVLQYFQQNKMVIDWDDYIAHALKDGAKYQGLKTRIVAAVGDVYGPIYCQKFQEQLKQYEENINCLL